MSIKTLTIIIISLSWGLGLFQLVILGDVSPNLGRLHWQEDSKIVDSVLTERSNIITLLDYGTDSK